MSEEFNALIAALERESADGRELLADIENNSICTVALDPEIPAINVIWKRYATSAQLRFVHATVLKLIVEHRVSKVLGDDTDLPTIHPEDRVWILDVWLPKAVTAGLKAAASKKPSSYFGQLAVTEVQSRLNSVTFAVFDNIVEARTWLKNVHI